jgi:hypothetical protein
LTVTAGTRWTTSAASASGDGDRLAAHVVAHDRRLLALQELRRLGGLVRLGDDLDDVDPRRTGRREARVRFRHAPRFDADVRQLRP